MNAENSAIQAELFSIWFLDKFQKTNPNAQINYKQQIRNFKRSFSLGCHEPQLFKFQKTNPTVQINNK
jgi:hypothetical protein